MKKLNILAVAALIMGASFSYSFSSGNTQIKSNEIAKVAKIEKNASAKTVYTQMKLDGVINYDAFEKAFIGYNKIDGKKKDLLTIIDFSKPSTQERFYVLDMKNGKILHKSHVSHGKNSGGNMATSFSNRVGSNQSSLGFYLTEGTYQGKNGYSLRMDGLERGINDKAKDRAIVVHGADYANPSVIKSLGRLGRSQGCPALPRGISKKVIDTIKGGSVMYIHANNSSYAASSSLIRG